MKSSKVAKRYARALMGLSSDRDQLEIWGVELERLGGIMSDAGIEHVFDSPEVSTASKIEGLAKVAEKLELSFPVRSFTAVVARHGRIDDLPAVAEAYRRMLDDLMGRARATLTFAMQPADAELQRIVASLERIAHKKIIPTIKIDATLLGGVIVELEGKTYDGSLAARLAGAQQLLVG